MTLSDVEDSFSCLKLSNSRTVEVQHDNAIIMFTHESESVYLTCNFKCCIETEGLVKVTGSKVKCKSCIGPYLQNNARERRRYNRPLGSDIGPIP